MLTAAGLNCAVVCRFEFGRRFRFLGRLVELAAGRTDLRRHAPTGAVVGSREDSA